MNYLVTKCDEIIDAEAKSSHTTKKQKLFQQILMKKLTCKI